MFFPVNISTTAIIYINVIIKSKKGLYVTDKTPKFTNNVVILNIVLSNKPLIFV
jgi:hypothetical protein